MAMARAARRPLATTLTNLGVCLAAVGRREKAETAWAEAVGLNAGIE
jgi:Flp pilus assembly protein TadD